MVPVGKYTMDSMALEMCLRIIYNDVTMYIFWFLLLWVLVSKKRGRAQVGIGLDWLIWLLETWHEYPEIILRSSWNHLNTHLPHIYPYHTTTYLPNNPQKTCHWGLYLQHVVECFSQRRPSRFCWILGRSHATSCQVDYWVGCTTPSEIRV